MSTKTSPASTPEQSSRLKKRKAAISPWLSSHRTFISIIIAIIFAALNLLFALNHEPTPSATVFWQNLTGSTTNIPLLLPCLISVTASAIAIFLLWRFSPFGHLANLIFTTSAAFFYFTPASATPYSLLPLAAILLIITFASHNTPLKIFSSLFALASIALIILNQPPLTSISASSPLDFLPSLNRTLFGLDAPVFEVSLALISIYLLARHTKYFFITIATLAATAAVFIFLGPDYTTDLIQKSITLLLILLVIAAIIVTREQKGTISSNKFAATLRRVLSKTEIVRIATHLLEKTPENTPNAKTTHASKNATAASAVFCIPFLLSIPHTISAAIQDLNEPVSPAFTIAEIMNELPASSVIILRDDSDQLNFISAEPLLTDGRTFFDPISKSPQVSKPHDQSAYAVLSEGITDENLQQLFDTLEQSHDHIYYIADRPSCEKASYHNDVLENYTYLKDFSYTDLSKGAIFNFKLYQIK